MQQVLNWLMGLVVIGALIGIGLAARRIQQPKVILLNHLPAAPDAVVLAALTSATRGWFGVREWKWSFGSLVADEEDVALSAVDLRNGAEWIRLTYRKEPSGPVTPETPFRVVLSLQEYAYDGRWMSVLLLGKLPKRPTLRMRTKLIRALPRAARRAHGQAVAAAERTAV